MYLHTGFSCKLIFFLLPIYCIFSWTIHPGRVSPCFSQHRLLCYTGHRQITRGNRHVPQRLTSRLAKFIQQELASGTYQSEDELMIEAVRLLKARTSHRQTFQQTNGGPADIPLRTPADYTSHITRALETGDPMSARQLALEGAKRYPDHAELQKFACILAPPPGKVVPSTPESRAATKADHAG